MYPLPPELSAKICYILDQGSCEPVAPEEMEWMHDRIAAIFVRENRRLRQQVADLGRDFAEAAERDDGDYGAICAAAAGEETCKHVNNEIIKKNVYFNTEEAEERERQVDKLIQDLFEADDPHLDT